MSNSGCWSSINDVHGFGGVPYRLTMDECQSVCVDSDACVAVDWEGSAEDPCWIQTSPVTAATTEPGFITHYELNRAFLSQSHFSLHIVLF